MGSCKLRKGDREDRKVTSPLAGQSVGPILIAALRARWRAAPDGEMGYSPAPRLIRNTARRRKPPRNRSKAGCATFRGVRKCPFLAGAELDRRPRIGYIHLLSCQPFPPSKEKHMEI